MGIAIIGYIFLIWQIDTLRDSVADLLALIEDKEYMASVDSKPEVSQPELTQYEMERLEREEQFDQRITRLKEEMASVKDYAKQGVEAEELHPLVKNLPHDVIRERNDLPDVEYTE